MLIQCPDLASFFVRAITGTQFSQQDRVIDYRRIPNKTSTALSQNLFVVQHSVKRESRALLLGLWAEIKAFGVLPAH